MSKITIEVNDDEIARAVEEMIAKAMVSEYGSTARDAKYGVRKAIETSVKDYVYSKKDAIIEKCITRASAELVRKGLPKLLASMEDAK